MTAVYCATFGALAVQASAHAATAGFGWLVNPVGSTKLVQVQAICFCSQLGSALVAPTSPRVRVERVTFTGAASGASVALCKTRSTDPAPASSVRTASTGLSLSAGDCVTEFLPTASATAVGYAPASVQIWPVIPVLYQSGLGFSLPVRVFLAAGEGLVVRQADNGTTSDTRRFVVGMTITEE